jgi:hypothetical protein
MSKMKSRHQGMRRGGEGRCDVYHGRRERSTWRIQQAWARVGRSSPVAWWSSAFTPSRPGPDDDGGGVGEGRHLAVNAEEASTCASSRGAAAARDLWMGSEMP